MEIELRGGGSTDIVSILAYDIEASYDLPSRGAVRRETRSFSATSSFCNRRRMGVCMRYLGQSAWASRLPQTWRSLASHPTAAANFFRGRVSTGTMLFAMIFDTRPSDFFPDDDPEDASC